MRFALTAMLAWSVVATAASESVDVLSPGASAWLSPDASRWHFVDGDIVGDTLVYDGAKTDPEASTFLVSRQTFGGDLVVSLDITFEIGRYLGVYLDFGQQSQTGIWMATGHPLAEDPKERSLEVETAYIKTVERSDWTVRTEGELIVEPGTKLLLRFVRKGDDYSVWHADRLIVTYRKPGGYPPGPLQIRLTNARARIHRLEVQADWHR